MENQAKLGRGGARKGAGRKPSATAIEKLFILSLASEVQEEALRLRALHRKLKKNRDPAVVEAYLQTTFELRHKKYFTPVKVRTQWKDDGRSIIKQPTKAAESIAMRVRIIRNDIMGQKGTKTRKKNGDGLEPKKRIKGALTGPKVDGEETRADRLEIIAQAASFEFNKIITPRMVRSILTERRSDLIIQALMDLPVNPDAPPLF